MEGAGSRHLARARQALHAKIQLLLAPLVNRYATTPDLARRHRQLLAVTEEDDPAQGRNRAVGSLASAGRATSTHRNYRPWRNLTTGGHAEPPLSQVCFGVSPM